MISDEVAELLELPEYYIDELNSTPVQNFWCVIENLCKVINIGSFVEIGSERGITSKKIADSFYSLGVKITIVDPIIDERSLSDDRICLFQGKSKEFLCDYSDMGIDAVLIDGDHNYETVSLELSQLSQIQGSLHCHPMIFLHDVSWMWARRDMFYEYNSNAETKGLVLNKSLRLENEELYETGFHSGESYAMRDSYGGAGNGVLTAVEDFLDSNPEWSYFSFPIFYGLGILYRKDIYDSDAQLRIENVFQSMQCFKPLMSIAEANRLRLLQEYNLLYSVAEERIAELKRVGQERDELYSVAEERLAELNRVGQERDGLYSVAEERRQKIEKYDSFTSAGFFKRLKYIIFNEDRSS